MQVIKNVEKKVFPSSPQASHTWVLSMNDLVMPPVSIRWVSFYENDGSSDFMSPEKLESSLAKALDYYPLLAGRLVQLPLGCLQIEYQQDDPQGCSLTFATANFTLATLKQLNYAQKEIPDELKPGTAMATLNSFFSAQATTLACGSVAMSYSLHHKVGDGYSVHHLIEKWSRLCRGLEVEKPLLDRNALKPNSEPLVDVHPEFKVVTNDNVAPAALPAGIKTESVRFVFSFSAEKVALLKSVANTGLEAGRWVSTNDCIVTLVWRILTRARGLKAGDVTVCGIAGDGRKKWHTTLGDMAQYFGNFVAFPMVNADAEALLKSTLGEAALLLRDQVERMDAAWLQSSLNWIDRVHDKSTIQGNFRFFLGNDIFVSSWLTFPMYDCDFGWGKPTKVILHAPGMDGICLILPRGPSKDVDKNGLEVVLGVSASHAEKIMQDAELLQFASVTIDN